MLTLEIAKEDQESTIVISNLYNYRNRTCSWSMTDFSISVCYNTSTPPPSGLPHHGLGGGVGRNAGALKDQISKDFQFKPSEHQQKPQFEASM